MPASRRRPPAAALEGFEPRQGAGEADPIRPASLPPCAADGDTVGRPLLQKRGGQASVLPEGAIGGALDDHGDAAGRGTADSKLADAGRVSRRAG